MEISNEHLPDPEDDDLDFDEEENERPDGYECFACGNFQATTGMGHTCDKCGAGALNEYYI